MYTIYKGLKPNGEWKIGCDSNYPSRALEQNLTDYFILEEYENGWIAGDRELELQKEHNVRIDPCHYMITLQRAKKGGETQGPISGRLAVESGHLEIIRTRENQSKGGKTSGRLAVESGRINSMRSKEASSKGGKKNRHFTSEQIKEIRFRYENENITHHQLSIEFNTSRKTITNIINYKSYKDL